MSLMPPLCTKLASGECSCDSRVLSECLDLLKDYKKLHREGSEGRGQ